jgi:uncharacterized RDD family membrane protein YckC
MDCPQCQSDQIDETGVCPACGYKANAAATAPPPESENTDLQSTAGASEREGAEGEPGGVPTGGKPQWRQELSERLQAIRQRRENADLSGRTTREAAASISTRRISVVPPPVIPSVRVPEDVPLRKPVPKPLTPIPRQRTLEPIPQEPSAHNAQTRPADSLDIRSLIDNAISKKSLPAEEHEDHVGFFEFAESQFPENEGKLILLSRTLCGLVDLIIVLVSTGGLILAADFFSGIIVLDAVSYMYFALLFLLTYFSYSLFFLAASSQTIGMMITDLRVVGVYHERPSFRQLFQRCWGFLLSLLGWGFGLIWGLFDRESLCFHDRISDTQIIRM